MKNKARIELRYANDKAFCKEICTELNNMPKIGDSVELLVGIGTILTSPEFIRISNDGQPYYLCYVTEDDVYKIK